jgi:hypothetical protein
MHQMAINLLRIMHYLMFIYKKHDESLTMLFFKLPQAVSLLLLSAYYKFLGGFPSVAVAGLLLYVGCYQVTIFSFKYRNLLHHFF